MIRFQRVSFRYGSNEDWVLRDIDFMIRPGERLAIVGSNGSGKSTFGLLMNGLLTPTEGNVLVFGRNTRASSDLAEIRKRIGLVFQNPDQQLVANTIEDSVAFGLENLGVSPSDQERRIAEVLRKVRLDALKHMDPNLLTPGQKQQLVVAGVIVMEPEVIVLDEAGSMLSSHDLAELRRILKDIHERGTTVVQITHDMEELYDCDRVLVLKDGTVFMDGPPVDILVDTKKLTAAHLLPPFTIRVRDTLTNQGFQFAMGTYTEDEIVERICEFVSKT